MGKDKELREKVNELTGAFESLRHKFYDSEKAKFRIVECEKCGCLLKKETAIKGKSEVRERYTTATAIYYNLPPEEYIHETYYCKKCGKK